MRLSTSASLAGSCKVRWEMTVDWVRISGVAALEVIREQTQSRCLH